MTYMTQGRCTYQIDRGDVLTSDLPDTGEMYFPVTYLTQGRLLTSDPPDTGEM